jgi:hypothetical protein
MFCKTPGIPKSCTMQGYAGHFMQQVYNYFKFLINTNVKINCLLENLDEGW